MDKNRELDIPKFVNESYEKRKEQERKLQELRRKQMRHNVNAFGTAKVIQKKKKPSVKKIAAATLAIVAIGMFSVYSIAENDYRTKIEAIDNVEVVQGHYSPTAGPEPNVYYYENGERIPVTFEKIVNHLVGNSDIDEIEKNSGKLR